MEGEVKKRYSDNNLYGVKQQKIFIHQDEIRHLPRMKMKKRPLKLQPLSGEVNLQEETGRRLSESLISRISSGTMKGV